MANVSGPRILRLAEVFDLPNPVWQVQGLIPEGALVCLYGAPGEGKTFVTIDLALSIAAGVDWHGREVKQGAVVYIAAEGGGGVKARARAWLKHHGVESLENAFVVLESIDSRNGGRWPD